MTEEASRGLLHCWIFLLLSFEISLIWRSAWVRALRIASVGLHRQFGNLFSFESRAIYDHALADAGKYVELCLVCKALLAMSRI